MFRAICSLNYTIKYKIKMSFRIAINAPTALSETFVLDKNRPIIIPVMRDVYMKEYVYTGKMSREELDTYLSYLESANFFAHVEEYSKLIRTECKL